MTAQLKRHAARITQSANDYHTDGETTPLWHVRMDKTRSTWNWFTTNPQGGGLGSNYCGARCVALARALRGIPKGEAYTLAVNGKVTVGVV